MSLRKVYLQKKESKKHAQQKQLVKNRIFFSFKMYEEKKKMNNNKP